MCLCDNREGFRELVKVSSVDDLERIRLSRHKMEKYVGTDFCL